MSKAKTMKNIIIPKGEIELCFENKGDRSIQMTGDMLWQMLQIAILQKAKESGAKPTVFGFSPNS